MQMSSPIQVDHVVTKGDYLGIEKGHQQVQLKKQLTSLILHREEVLRIREFVMCHEFCTRISFDENCNILSEKLKTNPSRKGELWSNAQQRKMAGRKVFMFSSVSDAMVVSIFFTRSWLGIGEKLVSSCGTLFTISTIVVHEYRLRSGTLSPSRISLKVNSIAESASLKRSYNHS